MKSFIFCIIGYLLGSISSAIIICKFYQLPDPRSVGSGNPGTTNVMRMGNSKAAALVLVGDALKGFIAIMLARFFNVDAFSLSFVALFTVIGHMYPVYFGFKGGRGVATAFGALLGLSFFVAIFSLVIWQVVFFFTRYSSLAAIFAAAAMPMLAVLFDDARYFVGLVLMTAIILFKHRDNIYRLLDGTEPKTELKPRK
ncbi:MAG: glycerol-3-phosphate 1-O-acyltransferase PlsY [Proteobacteria bacterium]|nr:glycerol-3-phosphate 1-O-acyltransferase PlsY [Pseudomonadota bacterium]